MLEARVNEKTTFQITKENEEWKVNEVAVSLDVKDQPNGLISVLYNGKSFTAQVEKIDAKSKEISLRVNGQVYTIAIREEIDQLLSSMGLDLKAMQKIEPVKAPMPGLVLKVLVEPGQEINKGDGLLILEAMKMENILKASGTAKVKSIKVDERTAVEKGTVLIELE